MKNWNNALSFALAAFCSLPPASAEPLDRITDTSSGRPAERIDISVKKGSLRMRGWTLEARVGSELRDGNRADDRIRLNFRLPKRLWNSGPGPIHRGRSKSYSYSEEDGYFTQTSSGILFNLGVEAEARVPLEGKLYGPQHTVVNAEGIAAWTYQIALYRLTRAEAIRTALLNQAGPLRARLALLRAEPCEKAKNRDSAATEAEAIRLRWEGMCDELGKIELDYPESSLGILTDSAKWVDALKDLKKSAYNQRYWDAELNALIDAMLETSKLAERYRNLSEIKDDGNEPTFFTFDVRLAQAGATYARKDEMGVRKSAGTLSAAAVSFEAGILFADLANLVLQGEIEPFKSEWGHISYNQADRAFSMRSEGALGASLTVKGVTLKDKTRLGLDWSGDGMGSTELRNELSLGVLANRGRVGWSMDYEQYKGSQRVKTHIFFLEAAVF